MPSVLQEVQVPIIENQVCQDMFETAGHSKAILSSFLCAGYANGQRDSCEVLVPLDPITPIGVFCVTINAVAYLGMYFGGKRVRSLQICRDFPKFHLKYKYSIFV